MKKWINKSHSSYYMNHCKRNSFQYGRISSSLFIATPIKESNFWTNMNFEKKKTALPQSFWGFKGCIYEKKIIHERLYK